MRIHHDARRQAKGGTQNHIGRFSSDTRQLHHVFHRLRHLAVVSLDKSLTESAQRFRLIVKKSGWADILLQFLDRHRQIVFGLEVFSKESLRYLVHSLVRALSRENGRNEKFKRGYVT